MINVSQASDFTGVYAAITSENETLTQATWKDLFNKSKECVPGFVLGFIECKTGQIFAYDGIALKKYLRVNPSAKDPSTNLPIAKVHYLYVKTFNLDETEIVQWEMNLVEEKRLIDALPFLKQFYETGLNYHGFSNAKNETAKKLIAKSQFIFGSNLFLSADENIKKEGVRWLHCSANNRCKEAAKLLTHIYQRGVSVQQDSKKASYFANLHNS